MRYSIDHPHVYASSNLDGFLNILEACRHNGCGHLLYASSSSVYGANTKVPFSVEDNVDHPISLYAATKKANELMAHAYSHLYRLPCTGLRFFTVYGAWGRPDMATYLFADAIANGRPIQLFNNGDMRRDFTYVDDVAEAVVRLMDHVPQAGRLADGPGTSAAPWRVYNIGNNKPEELMKVVALFERELGRTAHEGIPADAAGRRSGDLCRRRRPRARDRLPAENLDRGGDSPVRRLVSRLSQGLTAAGIVYGRRR